MNGPLSHLVKSFITRQKMNNSNLLNLSGLTNVCSANLDRISGNLFISLNFVSGTFAVGGNTLVLMTVFKTRSLRKPSFFFVASLSLADLFVGLIVNPIYVAITILGVWVSDHPLYKVENFLWIQTLAATSFNLLVISCDRYLAIVHALRYNSMMTNKKAFVLIGVTWLSSVLLALIFSLFMKQDFDDELWFATVVITFLLPLFIIIYCYYHIFKAARTQVAHMNEVNFEASAQAMKKHKTAKVIAVIITLFVASFAPNLVFAALGLTSSSHCQKLTVYRHWSWAIFLAYTSSCVNPWIYALKTREFRTAFQNLLNQVFVMFGMKI